MQHADAAIAGAGIIGLAAALELASAGLKVVVFERGHAMRECSWAAAGMLAAADPENLAALQPLARFSRSLYPDFLAKVEGLSGKAIPIRTTQTLQGLRSPAPPLQALSAEAVNAIVPELQLRGLGFFSLEEESLDPRDLACALPDAAKAAGVTLHEQTEVTGVSTQSGSVRLMTTRGEWSAGHFINACGAWAGSLAGISIAPRKGQLLLVESPEQLAVAIRTPEVYLVPRGDGHIVIGATVEDAGYDKQVDPAVIAALQSAASELWPPIRNARVIEAWAGLRPAALDSLPIIGPVPDDRNSRSWLALGHFRNGILLAPGTARILRQMILREPLRIETGAFSAGRFAESLAQ
ncbi:MAG TPA: FAD-dependent oxidoreductase [Silvibacterium sp.]|nr:FAD-dependent oxidoreductase [Silvibacterium sp.]